MSVVFKQNQFDKESKILVPPKKNNHVENPRQQIIFNHRDLQELNEIPKTTSKAHFMQLCKGYLLSGEVKKDNEITNHEAASFFEYLCKTLQKPSCQNERISYQRLPLGIQMEFVNTICPKGSQYISCLKNLRKEVAERNEFGYVWTSENASQVEKDLTEYCSNIYGLSTEYHLGTTAPSPVPLAIQGNAPSVPIVGLTISPAHSSTDVIVLNQSNNTVSKSQTYENNNTSSNNPSVIISDSGPIAMITIGSIMLILIFALLIGRFKGSQSNESSQDNNNNNAIYPGDEPNENITFQPRGIGLFELATIREDEEENLPLPVLNTTCAEGKVSVRANSLYSGSFDNNEVQENENDGRVLIRGNSIYGGFF